MAGLTDQAGGGAAAGQSRQAWQESMLRKLGELRTEIQRRSPEELAQRCGATLAENVLRLPYWSQDIGITWPELEAQTLPDRKSCSTFDQAMLMYYLHRADGAHLAGRWISFRELPNGGFYSQAFQGYSGDLIGKAFGEAPDTFDRAAQARGGWPLPDLAAHAFGFQPLPRIRLAAVLWPGDDEFPARASVLFDASSSHYMITDGLALLGSGLTHRFMEARPPAFEPENQL